MFKLENAKYNLMFDETKPINRLNLPSDIVEDTMINIVEYQVDKEVRDIYEGRNHYYEIRFSSAKEDECWIGDSEIAYTLRESVKIWKIMRQELIDERDQKQSQVYLTNRMLPVLRRE